MRKFPALIVLFLFLFALRPLRADTAVPLTELCNNGTYLGEEGCLYPGSNTPPPAAMAVYEAIAAENAADQDLVGACIGISMMQNACGGFLVSGMGSAFGANVNPNLTIINAAVGSKQQQWELEDSVKWDEAIARITAAGYMPEDMDFIIFHSAWAGPSTLPFPDHAINMLNSLEITYQIIQEKFPNIRIIYVMNRHYAYSPTTKHPEPFAYEEGYSWKWLVQKWINGEIVGKPIAWGADQWNPEWAAHPEYYSDGLHLSGTGQNASAQIWTTFWSNSSYIAPWHLANPPATPTPSSTPIPTATPTVTPTAVPGVTATPSATPFPTDTPSATSAATVTPTITATGCGRQGLPCPPTRTPTGG